MYIYGVFLIGLLGYEILYNLSENAANIARSQRGNPRGHEADDEPGGRELEEAGSDDPHPAGDHHLHHHHHRMIPPSIT